MDEQYEPGAVHDPASTGPESAPDVEPLSITDRFVGILTEPSVTYENVRATGPRTSNWLLPLLIVVVIFGIGMALRFQHPEMMQLMQQQQQERIEKAIESGDMTQEKADEMAEQMEQFSGVVAIIAPFSSAIGFAFFVFVIVLLYWLLLRFGFRTTLSFNMTLNVYGLILFIGAIDQLVSILLMLLTDRAIITLSPALLMQPDLNSVTYKAMLQLNPITIWSLVVLGIGFEKVTELSRSKAMVAAFSVSIVMIVVSQFLGWGG